MKRRKRPPAISMAEKLDGRLGACAMFPSLCCEPLGLSFSGGTAIKSTVRLLVRPPPAARARNGSADFCLRRMGADPHGVAQNLGNVQGSAAGSVADLMPARKAVGGDQCVRLGLAHARQ